MEVESFREVFDEVLEKETKMLHKSLAIIALSVFLYLCGTPFQEAAAANTETLPQGTRVYVVLGERVSSKRGESEVGQPLRCQVWRDVVVDGAVVVKAGSPVMASIATIRRSNIVGTGGNISIAAFETTAVDGQTVQLNGGYMKQGESRIGTSIILGAIAWPLIFIPGHAAECPEGMVFDASTGLNMNVKLPSSSIAPTIDLSGALSSFSAEVLLNNLQGEKKPEVFQIRVKGDGSPPQQLVIDSVNGRALTEPLPLEIKNMEPTSEAYTILAEIPIKALAKHFQKGINRFEVSYGEGDNRIATEVVLNIQM